MTTPLDVQVECTKGKRLVTPERCPQCKVCLCGPHVCPIRMRFCGELWADEALDDSSGVRS